MIKTIIFDNNGVLTDKGKMVSVFANHLSVSEDALSDVLLPLFPAADAGEITTTELFDTVATKMEREYDHRDTLRLLTLCYGKKDDMFELVTRAGKNYQVAMITNFIDCFDAINNDFWHFGELFKSENIFVSAKIGMIKPNEDIYRYTLEKVGKKPEEVIFIDDYLENVEAAKKLGINGILFKNREQLEKELAKYGVK